MIIHTHGSISGGSLVLQAPPDNSQSFIDLQLLLAITVWKADNSLKNTTHNFHPLETSAARRTIEIAIVSKRIMAILNFVWYNRKNPKQNCQQKKINCVLV